MMTPEKIAKLKFYNSRVQAITEAIKTERETCAKVVEMQISPHEDWVDRDKTATAIRARGTE